MNKYDFIVPIYLIFRLYIGKFSVTSYNKNFIQTQ